MKNEMELLNLNNGEITIKSTDLVGIINQFREVEGNRKELLHKTFIEKIRKELEVLESLGFRGQQNILPSSYINSQNKKQPCFELNRDGMLQMLNSESVLVRFKTIEYISKLEKQIKEIIPILTDEQKLQLSIFNAKSKEDAVLASAELDRFRKGQILELEEKIEEDEPLVELARKRLDGNGLLSITDTTKTFELKKGKITKWAKNNGYLHKTSTEVNKLGDEYFKVYDAKGFKCIGINENGLKLINEHLDEIKAS